MADAWDTVPDFYMLGGHSCGRLALSYFLSWQGAVVSSECSVFLEEMRNHYNLCKIDRIYARGMTVDIINPKRPVIGLGQPDRPIVWITRDPVDTMISFYNWTLADACFGKFNTMSLLESEFLPICYQHLPVLCLYDSLRNSLASRTEAFVLDMEDINAENALNTLRKITDYLNIPFNEKVASVTSIQFNAFKNRIWSRQPFKRFPYDIFSYLQPVYVIPSHLMDFHYNTWLGPQHVLDEFSYNNQDYMAIIPEKAYLNILPHLPKKFFNEKMRKSCKRWIDVWLEHCAVTARLYEERKMTPEKALEIMRETPRFRSRFLRLMDRSLRQFTHDHPNLVEKWKNFNQLSAA